MFTEQVTKLKKEKLFFYVSENTILSFHLLRFVQRFLVIFRGIISFLLKNVK
jgi:hypothetical protein